MISIAQAQRQRLAMVCEQVLQTPGMDAEIVGDVAALLAKLRGVNPEIQTRPQAAPNNKARKAATK